MVKKLLHRLLVVWCLYGLVKLCIFVNPWIFRLAKLLTPVFEDNSDLVIREDIPWNSAEPIQIMFLWFLVFVGMVAVFLVSVGLHGFSNWFFNEAKNDSD